jgi:hypothetical protein
VAPGGVEPVNVVVLNVEHDYAGKRGREGGAVRRECASRGAAAGAGAAAPDVEREYGGASAGLCVGDASGACACRARR